MYLSHTSHFEAVIRAAERHYARSVSIQNYYTFCNFTNEADAEAFIKDVQDCISDVQHLGVNPHRYPGKYWEVAVHHPR